MYLNSHRFDDRKPDYDPLLFQSGRCSINCLFFYDLRQVLSYSLSDFFYFFFGSFLNITERAITAIITIAPADKSKSVTEGLNTFCKSVEYF